MVLPDGTLYLRSCYCFTEPLIDEALYRIPALETVEIRQIVNGPESFTPDTLPLLGEAPEVNSMPVYVYP